MSDTEKSAQAQPNESAEPSFRYNAKLAQGIEEKWQKIWDDEGTFWAANVNGDLKDGKGHNAEGRPSYFAMDMFPYPSGKGLHVGHPLGYLATDVVSRYHRMKGENVLHAMGYDAFGLPAEQYAVQTGQHPRITTEQNIANMRRQLHRMGLSFDNRRSFATIDPGYVRRTRRRRCGRRSTGSNAHSPGQWWRRSGGCRSSGPYDAAGGACWRCSARW